MSEPPPHVPRKRFGQHFLHDPAIVARILTALDPRPGQPVVEIGPGLGALTRSLLERLGELDVVELDRDLIPDLRQRLGPLGTLRIHETDALHFDYRRLATHPHTLRIVGNLPYNISTPLIFHLLDQAEVISDMHFMLQREVVERMRAAPGGADYGRLSVMVQYRCRVARLFTVQAGAFRPPPKVTSAFVRLIPHQQPPVTVCHQALFETVVRQAFAHRRKTLRNALRNTLSEDTIREAGLDPGQRPQTVSLSGYAGLSCAAANKSGDVTSQT